MSLIQLVWPLLMLLHAPSLAAPAAGVEGVMNVRDLGAQGDGSRLETAVLQRAIDSCALKGGEVLFPAGVYLTGSLELRSNVTLHLLRGALILGSREIADYREHRPQMRSYNDQFLRHSLFYAERASNFGITGEGTIDGQGRYFKPDGKEKPQRYKNRPYLFRFVECTNVTVENVRLQNSAMWMQHYLACENVTIRGISVYNHANQNNDMMDIDGCRNVIIADCFGDTDDDGITLKSTSERPVENVVISNCVISSHCNAIKTGTESTGGFRNISISNCVVKPSAEKSVHFGKREGISGITLSVVDGGTFDGVTISGVAIDGPEVPIFIRLGNRARRPYEQAPAPGVGTLRNVIISNVQATNVKSIGCSITGLPGHAVENVTLENIRIAFAGGVSAPPSEAPAEREDSYPEATMWGALPSYGFFVRHAAHVKFRDCTFSLTREDARPAFIFDDTHDITVEGFEGIAGMKAPAALVLSGVSSFTVERSHVQGGAGAFVQLTGGGNTGIRIVDNDLRDVESVLTPAGRVPGVVLSGNLERQRR